MMQSIGKFFYDSIFDKHTGFFPLEVCKQIQETVPSSGGISNIWASLWNGKPAAPVFKEICTPTILGSWVNNISDFISTPGVKAALITTAAVITAIAIKKIFFSSKTAVKQSHKQLAARTQQVTSANGYQYTLIQPPFGHTFFFEKTSQELVLRQGSKEMRRNKILEGSQIIDNKKSEDIEKIDLPEALKGGLVVSTVNRYLIVTPPAPEEL